MANKPEKTIDWEAMRPHYEAGVITLKALGKSFGCSDAAIIKHAAKADPPWTRNLKDRIRSAADAKVSEAVVSARAANHKANAAQVVEGNATLQANIRLEHRQDIKKARALTVKFFRELETAAKGKGSGKAKVKGLDLPQRALVAKNLTEAMRVQIALERQAFGIDDRDNPPPDGAEFSERLINARQRAANR